MEQRSAVAFIDSCMPRFYHLSWKNLVSVLTWRNQLSRERHERHDSLSARKLLDRGIRRRPGPVGERGTHRRLPALRAGLEPRTIGHDRDLRGLPPGARAGADRVRQPVRRHRPQGGHPDGTRRPRRRLSGIRSRTRPHLGLHRPRAHGHRRGARAEPGDRGDGRVRRARRRTPGQLGDDRRKRRRPCARDDRRGSARAVRPRAAAPELLGARGSHGARHRIRPRASAPHAR